MFKKYLKQIYDTIGKPQMRILPGHLAFFLILSIFPLLTLLGFICSQFSLFSESFISALKSVLPQNFLDVFLPFLTESHVSGNVIFFMIVGFVLVSNGTFSIITVSDEMYNIPYSNYIWRRIKAFVMIVIMIILFVFIFVVLAYGNTIVDFLTGLDFFAGFKGQIYTFFMILKWPIAFAFIFLILKWLYTIAPDARIPSKYMNKGALFTTIGVIVTTFVYSFYVSNFANYSLFYGSISGVIALMTWIYFLSFILVMGIAINSNEYLSHKIKQNKQDN